MWSARWDLHGRTTRIGESTFAKGAALATFGPFQSRLEADPRAIDFPPGRSDREKASRRLFAPPWTAHVEARDVCPSRFRN